MTRRIQVDTAVVDIDSLVPYPHNPRRGDVDAIAESLSVNGQYRPIVVNRASREILAGNHTWRAAKSLGWRKIAVTFVDADPETAARIVLADNRTHDLGSYNHQGLLDLLTWLPDVEGTGFTAYDVAQMESITGTEGLFPSDTEPGSQGTTVDGRVVIEVGRYRLGVDPDAFGPWKAALVARVGEDRKRQAAEAARLIGFAATWQPPKRVGRTRRKVVPGSEPTFSLQDTEVVPVADLQPYARNAREGDIGAISESLRVNGQYRPLVVNRRDNTILVGNHTWAAAKALGWPTVAVTWVDVDDIAAARIVLADNRTAEIGTYDEDALINLLTGLDGLEGTGFDGDDLDDLIRGVSGQISAGRLHDYATVVVEKWREKVLLDAYAAWEDAIRAEFGWTQEEVAGGIVTRLGLPADCWSVTR
ncbi:MAG: ParB/RepB/Spo0J family partition protein [Actinomycetota bacterium]